MTRARVCLDSTGQRYRGAIERALALLADGPATVRQLAHRALSQLIPDRRMRHQVRCVGGCNRCVACGTHLELTIDHKHPVSRGGGNNIDNLQTMCMPCNNKKGART